VRSHPLARHTGRPSNRCRAGNDSTRVLGSHPASVKKSRSTILARRAAAPSRTTPSSTCGNSRACSVTADVLASIAAVMCPAPARSRGLGT